MKLYAVTNANGHPLTVFMAAGQFEDYTGTAASFDDLLKIRWLLGDRGHGADWSWVPCRPATAIFCL